MAKQRADPLEITHDASFQKREWQVQRIAWLAMALIALAALTGVFGRGLVATASVRAPGGELELEYERIMRHSVKTHLIVRLPTSKGEAGIWLDRHLLDNHELQQVIPEPERTTISGDRANYYFQVEPGAAITFVLEPKRLGTRRIRVGLSSTRTMLEVRSFVLP